jgi:hypothetical protein
VVGAALIVSFITPGLVYWLGLQPRLAYLLHVLVLLLVAAAFTSRRGSGALVGEPLVAAWLLTVLVSALLAGKADSVVAQSLLGYALMPVIYWSVINADMTRKEEDRVMMTLGGLVILQIPVVVLQAAFAPGVSADRFAGTLGASGTNYMGVLMAGAWCVLCAYLLAGGDRRAVWLLPLPIVPMVLGEIKAGFVMAAAGTLTLAFASAGIRQAVLRLAKAMVLAVLPLGAVYAIYRFAPRFITPTAAGQAQGLRMLSEPMVALDYLEGFSPGGQAQRLEALRIVAQRGATPLSFMFGDGPGTLSTGSVLGSLAGGGSAFPLRQALEWISSAGRFLLEIGVVGVGLYAALVARIGWTAFDSFRRTDDGRTRMLQAAMLGIVPVYLVGGLYAAAWQFDAVRVSFWVLAAMSFRAAAGVGQSTSRESRDAARVATGKEAQWRA